MVYPSVMLSPRSPTVTRVCAVPRVPCPPTMHRTDVSDCHSVPSHPVCPPRPITVITASPSPDPCTVTDADPVPAPFACTILDIELSSYDTCSDMTLRLAPMVMEAGNVLPVVKRVSLHARDVYDIHSLASQAVFPNPAICVQLDFMKPCPSMVSVVVALIVMGWLDMDTCDNTARSYDKASVKDPPCSWRVAMNAYDVEMPCGVLLNILVPDTHTELSHAVNPKRVPPEYVDISPSIEPVTVKISSPAGNRFTVVFTRRTIEIDTASELNTILLDPTLEPRVTKTPRLPALNLAELQRNDVSDSHSVASHPV